MKSKPNIRNRYLVLVDIILVVASILGAFALRFELGPLFFYYLPFAYWMIGVSLVNKTNNILCFWNVSAYVGLRQHPRTEAGGVSGLNCLYISDSCIVDFLFT